MSEVSLPPGSHYAVMWGIPEKYAGMTSAMLHRSRAFVRLANTPVTIVTYEFRDDYAAVRKQLADRGDMIDGISLINLWEDLRSWDPARLAASAPAFDEDPSATFSPLDQRGDHAHPVRNTLRRSDGHIDQVDYFRSDGSLLVSDRRDITDGPQRAVTLCDHDGKPLGTWRTVWKLYHFWLDSLPRDPMAYFIVDSKTSANHFASYKRPDAVTMHLVHGSHLSGTSRPHGEPNPGRKYTFERLDQWDAAVLLTQQQLDDVTIAYGPGTNRYVCPNGRDVPATMPPMDRPSHTGAMLASLTNRKRVSHAIKAISGATDRWSRLLRRPRPHLDIFGDGPRRKALRKTLETTRPRPSVTFHGYVDDAQQRLRLASFSLLTSTSEGQPLALIESMAAGCIPISYDIPYGPADVITDGVDGFLVDDADISALASRIRWIASKSPAELAPMREAGFARAQDFQDSTVTARWADIMSSAAAGKASTAQKTGP